MGEHLNQAHHEPRPCAGMAGFLSQAHRKWPSHVTCTSLTLLNKQGQGTAEKNPRKKVCEEKKESSKEIIKRMNNKAGF